MGTSTAHSSVQYFRSTQTGPCEFFQVEHFLSIPFPFPLCSYMYMWDIPISTCYGPPHVVTTVTKWCPRCFFFCPKNHGLFLEMGTKHSEAPVVPHLTSPWSGGPLTFISTLLGLPSPAMHQSRKELRLPFPISSGSWPIISSVGIFPVPPPPSDWPACLRRRGKAA